MKKSNLIALPMVALFFIAGLSPAKAETVEVPNVSLNSSSACIDTSYQLQTFQTKTKMVYPESHSSITSPYGGRMGINPLMPASAQEMHTGSDWASGIGTPVYAVASGIVTRASSEIYGTGQIITIEHDINGVKWTTMYLHVMNATEKIKKGDKVVTGQQIAREGATGNVTGPHLHFEVWQGGYLTGKSTDPEKWLRDNGAVDVTDNSIPNFTCNQGTVFDGKISSWDNVRNGEIDEKKLSPLPFNKKFQLESTAATDINAMNEAFKKEFTRDLPIVEAYKTLKQQNTESTTISGSPLPGLSNYGWAKAINLYYSNPSGGIKPLESVKDYNTFDDIEYKWLLANGPKYGWVNPIINQEDGAEPRAERFIYVGAKEATALPTKDDLQKYARASMIAYSWGDKEAQCLNTKWDTTSQWDPKKVKGDSVGIAQVSMVEKFGKDWATNADAEKFMSSPRSQIDDGLKAIMTSNKTPCG